MKVFLRNSSLDFDTFSSMSRPDTEVGGLSIRGSLDFVFNCGLRTLVDTILSSDSENGADRNSSSVYQFILLKSVKVLMIVPVVPTGIPLGGNPHMLFEYMSVLTVSPALNFCMIISPFKPRVGVCYFLGPYLRIR